MLNRIDYYFLGPLISIFAFFISWTCNARLGYSFFPKLFYALIAAFLNFIYILYWMIFRFGRNTCNKKT